MKVGDKVICINSTNADGLDLGGMYTIVEDRGPNWLLAGHNSSWAKCRFRPAPTEVLPKLDLSKPVQTIDGRSVRILCTDGPHPTKPVYGFVDKLMAPFMWGLDGEWAEGSLYNLVNVPPKPVEGKRVILLTKNGGICCTHYTDIETAKKKAPNNIAYKLITIKEGEGMQ